MEKIYISTLALVVAIAAYIIVGQMLRNRSLQHQLDLSDLARIKAVERWDSSRGDTIDATISQAMAENRLAFLVAHEAVVIGEPRNGYRLWTSKDGWKWGIEQHSNYGAAIDAATLLEGKK